MSENLEYNSVNKVLLDGVVDVATTLWFPFDVIVKTIRTFSNLADVASSNFKDQLSTIQDAKFNIVITRAKATFDRLAITENLIDIHPESHDYVVNTFEFSLHILQNAINEFQFKKLMILGDFWGKTIAEGNNDWDNLHIEGNILNNLTYRQLILLKLLADGFPEDQQNRCINNISICVELNQLLHLGFWKTSGVYFGTNNSGPIAISELRKTDFLFKFC